MPCGAEEDMHVFLKDVKNNKQSTQQNHFGSKDRGDVTVHIRQYVLHGLNEGETMWLFKKDST